MTILTNPFRAGSGIDINYNTGTIANSGVLSVDSNTGNLTLSAGTGISISGLTITNTGVDSLVAGTGISLSATTGSVTVTNSGVTSFQGDTGSISLSAGTGISISGLTISNSGVTSLQSETGALSLTAGTGIGISGLTISNDGVTSLTAGTGISLSGSTGGVTITNTGITSLTAGNGISVSGSTISMSGSYTGDFDININTSTTAPIYTNALEYTINGTNRFYNQVYASEGETANADGDYWFVGWGATGQHLLEVYGSGNVSINGVLNTGGSVIIAENSTGAFSGYDDNGNLRYWLGYQDSNSNDLYLRNTASSSNLYLTPSGGVYTGNTSVPTTIRNTLDNGSGDMAASGQLTAQYIDSNINNDNPNGTTPTVVLSIWGHGQGNPVSSTTTYYGLGISNSTLDFLTNGNFAWWYNDTQIASMNGSGDISIAGTATGGFAQFFYSGTIRVSVQALSYSITLPAGTWAGFITIGIFFVPLSTTYSYQIGVNLSGSAFVSGSAYGYSTLTNIAGGSGSNYPLDNFPPIPLEIESSGGTITFDVVNSDATDGMTSIFSGNSDNAFVITVFLVSTGTAS